MLETPQLVLRPLRREARPPLRDHAAMAGRVISLAPPSLTARFAAVAGTEPLSALAPAARRELEAVLAAAGAFEELPGKWQAALLAAEARAAGGVPPAGGCCGG